MISPSKSIVAVHRFVKLLGIWNRKICYRLNLSIGMVISNVDMNFSSNNWKSVMLENHSIQKDCEGITEEELKKLVWATDKLQQAINKNDRIAASRTNIEFHRLLYSNSRNNFLQKTTDSSWFLFESFLSARNEELHWWINLGMRNETTRTYN